MALEVDIQSVVDKFALALKGPRLLFDLWPQPRPQGRPAGKHTALAGATVLGITGAFESFAEDLVAAVLIHRGHGWAHVAANADLINPSLVTLRERLEHVAGISVSAPSGWSLSLPKQSLSSFRAWKERPVTWGDVLNRSESWIEVRHCLAHGAVTGIGAEIWPGPVSRASHTKIAQLPSANDPEILARVKGAPERRGLYLWPSVSCARIFSTGALEFASAVATALNQPLDTRLIPTFDDV